MRFIHTADWQIGKSFRRFGEREGGLKQARLDAIERIGEAALAHGATHVLVAGDLFDHFAPSDRTAREPVERMRRFGAVEWLIIPGNHDPHRPDGVWDRLARLGLPANVRPLLEPAPVALACGAHVLPAPLLRRSETADLTAWWDQAPTPPSALRIGLAHGAVMGFGSAQEASNPVDPARARSAGLAYLALGDWHRTLQISERVWYAGTPEPDRAGSQQIGKALLVEIAGPDAPPRVQELTTGAYRWETRETRVDRPEDVADLDSALRALPDTFRTVLRLKLAGALSLAARADLGARLAALEAVFHHLDADLEGVLPRPSEEDFDAIDFDGVLRTAAERLKARAQETALAAGDRKTAEDALVELYLTVARAREATP
jgi:DNA repair exonuclease SbcCD nuclease subunit